MAGTELRQLGDPDEREALRKRNTTMVRLVCSLSSGNEPKSPLLPVCSRQEPQKQLRLTRVLVYSLLLLALIGARGVFFSSVPADNGGSLNSTRPGVAAVTHQQFAHSVSTTGVVRSMQQELDKVRMTAGAHMDRMTKVEPDRTRLTAKMLEAQRRSEQRNWQLEAKKLARYVEAEPEREAVKQAVKQAQSTEFASSTPQAVTATQSYQGGPSVVLPTTAPSNVCQDEGAECEGWALIGECSKNTVYMHKQCRKSCGLCIPERHVNKVKLTDDYKEDEDEDEAQDHAHRAEYDRLLQHARRNAASHRFQACHDTSDSCQSWQRLGECMRNPEYMLGECKVSCGVCVDHDVES